MQYSRRKSRASKHSGASVARCRRQIACNAAKKLTALGLSPIPPSLITAVMSARKPALQAIAGRNAMAAIGRMAEGELFVVAKHGVGDIPPTVRAAAVKESAVHALTSGGFAMGVVSDAMDGSEDEFSSAALALGFVDCVVEDLLRGHPDALARLARRFPPSLRRQALEAAAADASMAELLEAAPLSLLLAQREKAKGLGDLAKKSRLAKSVLRRTLFASTGPISKAPLGVLRAWATAENAGLLHEHSLQQRRQVTLASMAATALAWADEPVARNVYKWSLLHGSGAVMGPGGRKLAPLVRWIIDSVDPQAPVVPQRRWTEKISLENALSAVERHRADLKAHADARKEQRRAAKIPDFGVESDDAFPRSAEVDGIFIRRIARVEAMGELGKVLDNCMGGLGHPEKMQAGASAYFAILDRGALIGAAEIGEAADGRLHLLQAYGPSNVQLPSRASTAVKKFVKAAGGAK
ncbi:hypothetical protein [Rhodoblastus sp.]|uniref:hypothetical protein n=1 Tax=Rhodoblastus sp. TaxID=1962975 RepID=UPI0026096670|nr:hypothetical protein [Rhodoblastus sp.]